ncbi:O-antigen ligase family protein [Herpetosiphon sp. NSE202]|uniref:O-antigen ligase family protein n=1 Tax=Herpetosiphon sp. NSE202 TaxID=3351349 RepID=UPI00363A3136
MMLARWRWHPLATVGVSGIATLAILALYRPKRFAPLVGIDEAAAHNLLFALALLALFAALAWLRPEIGLAGVAATIPFNYRSRGFWDGDFPFINGKYFPLHELLLLVVLGVTALDLGWRLLRGRSAWRVWWREHWRMLLLPLAWLLIATFAATLAVPEGQAEAWREWRWMIVEPLLLYGLILYWQPRYPVRRWLLWGLLAGSAIVAVIGILQWRDLDWTPIDGTGMCFSDLIVDSGGTKRTSSVYCHPNNLALWMDRASMLAVVAAAWTLWQFWRKRSWQTAAWSVLYLGASSLLVLSLMLTYSKGARFAVALVLIGLSCLPRRWWLPLITSVVLGGLLLYSSLSGPERLSVTGDSSSARLSIWRSATAMIADHPILGIGLDQFYFYFNPQYNRGYIEPALANDLAERNTAHPHNLLLDLWLRVGIGGLIIFASLAWRSVRRSWQIWHSDQPERWLALAAIAALLAGWLHGGVDQGYFSSDIAMVTWLAFGMIDSFRIKQADTAKIVQ